MDAYQESLAMHKEHHGKWQIASKVPLKDRADLSRAYTPGVAAVSTAIGKDRTLARDLTMKRNTVAVVTDGTAILGLGDLGPEAALPVMEGKAILFKEFAGVDAVPLCLATKDVDEIVRTVVAVAPTFGGINLEDISAPRCFEVERRLVEALDIPVMHDDQHGTSVVILAGLINVCKLKGKKAGELRVVMNGAGAAGSAVAHLLHHYGFSDIAVCDSKGAIAADRPGLDDNKRRLASYAKKPASGSLADAIKGADIFIGVSVAGALSADMVRSMNPDPVIFALANPVPEIMPDVAKSAGAFVVATGRSDFPNQVNNVLAFPGIFRGALDHGLRRFSPAIFVRAAESLAAAVGEPAPERILPDPLDRSISARVADAVRE